MNNQFTPGTWRKQGVGVVVGGGTGTCPIASVYNGKNAYTVDDEQKANTQLIAAAPELLEALKDMLIWAQRVKELNPGMEIFNATQAIAKAEGR